MHEFWNFVMNERDIQLGIGIVFYMEIEHFLVIFKITDIFVFKKLILGIIFIIS